jgi:hypothetical protein
MTGAHDLFESFRQSGLRFVHGDWYEGLCM